MMRNEELHADVKSIVLSLTFAAFAVVLAAFLLSGCASKTSTEDDTATSAVAQSESQEVDEGAGSGESSGQDANGADQSQEAQDDDQQSDSARSQSEGGEDPADKVLDSQSSKHAVTFTVQAPGYSAADGKIPVSVAGTTSGGEFIDATAYVGADGTGLSVPAGTYTVMVIESPLVANGVFYTAPDTSWEISVPEDLGQGEGYVVSNPMVFTKADLSTISSDVIETAYTYAISGGLDKATADAYKAALLD